MLVNAYQHSCVWGWKLKKKIRTANKSAEINQRATVYRELFKMLDILPVPYTCVDTDAGKYISIYVHVHTRACVCVCVCVCIYIYI